MAGTITHAYFAIDVYNKFDENLHNRFKNYKENLKTYAQGPDILFFSTNLFNHKKVNKIGNYVHKHNTKNLFINMVSYIKNNHFENNDELISFLYGYIMHYALDTKVHPYVIYKGGIFDKKKKDTYKYNSKHSDIESYIDTCKYYPLSNVKIIVNKEQLEDMLTELRLKTPDEVKKYQKILSNKDAILADAKEQADAIINAAQVQTEELINEHEIMQRAYAQANELIEQATAQAQAILDNATEEANSIRYGAMQYTDDMLAKLQYIIEHSIKDNKEKYDSLLSGLENVLSVVNNNRNELSGIEEGETEETVQNNSEDSDSTDTDNNE
ncbi:MAG TPA: hypothetical protein DEF08_09630 [Eubacterium sp.]|nr:hypothetical protein [Eubacterium sp.]